jgi:hypothetical protein
MRALLLIHGAVLQVAGFMSWKLQQLRSDGSGPESPGTGPEHCAQCHTAGAHGHARPAAARAH